MIAYYKELKEKSEIIKEFNAKKAVKSSELLLPISKVPGALIRHNTVFVFFCIIEGPGGPVSSREEN